MFEPKRPLCPRRYQFKHGAFPYWYECPQCHDKEPFQQSEDELLRDMYDIPNDLPIFFECSFCPGVFMKPIGYTGASGYDMAVDKDDDNDDFFG